MPKTVMIAISGPSCSGKTTLARLLHSTLKCDQNSTLIHLDDFYKTDADIPLVYSAIAGKNVQDWDCIESLDVTTLERALNHFREFGTLPPDLCSIQDQNPAGNASVDHDVVSRKGLELSTYLSSIAASTPLSVGIVEGFCVFGRPLIDSYAKEPEFDVKLFLPIGHSLVKARREARKGYVTLEGFWEDPPGYVDDIVWPNWVRDHEELLETTVDENNIIQEVWGNENACKELGLDSMPNDCRDDMTACFCWAVDAILARLKMSGPSAMGRST